MLPETRSSWYALWTRSRHEATVREQLTRKRIEAFLPTVGRWSRWKDRRVKIQWPLFPGYCFARFPSDKVLAVLTCSGVVKIISFNGEPAPISNEEVEGLRRVVETEMSCDPCPLTKEGMLVKVINGPLKGIIGRLICKDAEHATVVLGVELINQAIRVTVHASDIRPK